MKIRKILLSLTLSGAMVLGLMPGMSMTAQADESETSYILTIPAALTVTDSGWNATDGVRATGSLASGKKLTVTASSGDEFALVNQNDNTQKVGYKLATTSADTEAATLWEFTELSSNVTAMPMGIIVEDYSSKPAGTYQDTVTFTAKVENSGVDLSKLTDNYEAKNGDVLTGTLSNATYNITIADGATVTLKDVNITRTSTEQFAGITPLGDATIVLEGDNSVTGGKLSAGITSAIGKTLTIKGTGTLTVTSNGQYGLPGAGIGSNYGAECGNIIIESGTINATGKYSSPGIGATNNGKCGNIEIKGGTVIATGGEGSAGIGTGVAGSNMSCQCGDITISGGTITATGATYGTGIGTGKTYSDSSTNICGDITITNAVKKVTAIKGNNSKNSIGVGGGEYGGTHSCGTITIGGNVTGNITDSPYTYQP